MTQLSRRATVEQFSNAFGQYARLTRPELEHSLRTGPAGLTSAQAADLLKRTGPNIIERNTQRWPAMLRRQFASSFVYLLLAAAAISFLLGERIDAVMIVLFVAINTGLGFFQEFQSEHTVRLLSQYVIRTVRVMRDGQSMPRSATELVPGDLLELEAGDIISADVRFVETNDLTVDESILTGEAAPAFKSAAPLHRSHFELHEAANIGFTGTTLVSGHGLGVVIETGTQTVLGDVARLANTSHRQSAFEKGLNRFSSFILRLIVVTLLFLFVTNLAIKGGSVGWIELAIFSVALAVSVIPEALPVVMTFSLSRGALRLARNHVVVKRLSAIEELGSIEVLCTDKTGTLTENSLSVTKIESNRPAETLRWAALASSAHQPDHREPNNAFDLALWHRLTKEQREELGEYSTIEEIPFDPERRRNSRLVQRQGNPTLIVRGAAEVILDFCVGLTADQIAHQRAWLTEQGVLGRRVIAVAQKALPGQTSYTVKDETDGLSLSGLISFVDPIKPSTMAAVHKAQMLGVQIKILTGDAKEVAGAVAREIGLIADPSFVLTGQALTELSPHEQFAAVKKYHVFARVSPQHKFHIITLLQQHNEVGFLGEGINDAPALKAANVALAVEGAADIAREAADIVLLKQSLEVIVDGIREGRAVFANTVKYLKITLASNFGNFYAITIASLLIDYLPMLPLQILLVNLLSDFPMIAIAADTTDPEELRRPRVYDVKEIALVATILGAVSSLFDFIFFAIFSRLGESSLHVYWFIGSILTELALIYSLRTRQSAFRARRPAQLLLWLSIIAAGLTISLPFIPWAQQTFAFIEPDASKLWLVFGIVAVYFIMTEAVKRLYYRFRATQ